MLTFATRESSTRFAALKRFRGRVIQMQFPNDRHINLKSIAQYSKAGQCKSLVQFVSYEIKFL